MVPNLFALRHLNVKLRLLGDCMKMGRVMYLLKGGWPTFSGKEEGGTLVISRINDRG